MSQTRSRKSWRIGGAIAVAAALIPAALLAADRLPDEPKHERESLPKPHTISVQGWGSGILAPSEIPVVTAPPTFLQPRSRPAQPSSEAAASSTEPAASSSVEPAASSKVTRLPPVTEPPDTAEVLANDQATAGDPAPAALAAPAAAHSDSPTAPAEVSAIAIDSYLGEAIRPASHVESNQGKVTLTSGLSTGTPTLAPPKDSKASESNQSEEPLQPVPDPQQGGAVTVEAASFKDITPGISTLSEVQKAWGTPKEIANRDSVLIHLYSVGPFEKVEVSFFQEKVTSIVIRLDKAFPANSVAQQLQLSSMRPVFVSNALGEILGQSFPERGVLLAFEPNDPPTKPSMKVSQIILEPISAESFVLRAETNLDAQLESSAKDLEIAIKLDPNNARAHWLHARVQFSLEDLPRALTAATQSVRLEPENPQYRVLRAQILGQMGQFSAAIEEARQAVETSDKRPHIKAQALCQLGDLYSSGTQPDYKKAMGFHVDAMKTAEPLAQSPHPAIRLAAKEVLVNAHLGASHDIAWGNWNQKEAAVSKWLERASLIAQDLVEKEGANEEHRFRVAVRALAAYVGLQGRLDPTPWADQAMKCAETLINASTAAAQKERFQWDLGMALYDAVQIYQLRGDHETALKYGQQAITHLEASAQKGNDATDEYLLARLYFRMGAIQAVGKQDHKAAIDWFDKARPVFTRLINDHQVGQGEYGRLGETCVSMGVSYWETGDRDKALEITQQGISLIEQMVQKGGMDSSTLEVPYSNLATMHRLLGQTSEAEALLQKANKLKGTAMK
jgi:tetratricopeptide (TPR) repeat protein